MAQNDFVIANDTAANVRADINSALGALVSLSSGSTDPSTVVSNSANMLWYDTTNNQVKMRSEADDAWVTLFSLNQTANTSSVAQDSSDTDLTNDPDAALRRDIGKSYVDGLAIGVGQTWSDVTGSRTHSTNYQNTTGRPIFVHLSGRAAGQRPVQVSSDASSWVDLVNINIDVGGAVTSTAAFPVPSDWYYRIDGVAEIFTWAELR